VNSEEVREGGGGGLRRAGCSPLLPAGSFPAPSLANPSSLKNGAFKHAAEQRQLGYSELGGCSELGLI
jgi:hypothetical protein